MTHVHGWALHWNPPVCINYAVSHQLMVVSPCSGRLRRFFVKSLHLFLYDHLCAFSLCYDYPGNRTDEAGGVKQRRNPAFQYNNFVLV